MKTLIIIPTLNAQKEILDVISDIEIHSPESDILVIDHGSTDRTKYLLKNNKINHLLMPLKTSYYDAVALGMMFASKNKYDAVIEWDDKGIFLAEDIKYFIATMERTKVDLVLGSRFIDKKLPRGFRWMGTRWLKRTFRIYTGAKVTDPTVRLKAYGKKAIKAYVDNDELRTTPDSIARFLRSGFTYKESSIKMNPKYTKQLHNSVASNVYEIFTWIMWMIFVLPFKRKKIKESK